MVGDINLRLANRCDVGRCFVWCWQTQMYCCCSNGHVEALAYCFLITFFFSFGLASCFANLNKKSHLLFSLFLFQEVNCVSQTKNAFNAPMSCVWYLLYFELDGVLYTKTNKNQTLNIQLAIEKYWDKF